jgi:aerobic-type carbon monoxide dehydrogenase small subunit (CoxS/CutS family)
MRELVKFTLNGKPIEKNLDSERMLLWVLRVDLALTGTKYGCGALQCGACTVLVDGMPVRSCQTPLADVQGKDVVTIEGLAHNGDLHPLQKAFMENDALQCGYCTPGMIMNAYALLKRNPDPSEAEIISGMEGNLCRCGAHQRIVAAIQGAAREMKEGA